MLYISTTKHNNMIIKYKLTSTCNFTEDRIKQIDLPSEAEEFIKKAQEINKRLKYTRYHSIIVKDNYDKTIKIKIK